jgi:hypothetical protein
LGERFLHLAEDATSPRRLAADAHHLQPRRLDDDADIQPMPQPDARVRDGEAAIRQRAQAQIALVSAKHLPAIDGEAEQAVELGARQIAIRQGGGDLGEDLVRVDRLAAS